MEKYLQTYCNLLGPSGLEDQVRNQIISDIKSSGCTYRVDPIGNLIVFKAGKKTRSKKVLLSAHMDEVGFMVTKIESDGYLRFNMLGGIDPRVVSGRRIVFCESGIHGLISSKSIHMQTAEERGKCEPLTEMYIDIGAKSKEDALNYISVGDCAVFEPNYQTLGQENVCSKALDDRFGCAALVSMINSDLKYDTYFSFNVCEEIGCDGAKTVAHQLKPNIVIALESTTAGDIADVPDNKCACKLGGGAVLSIMDNATIYNQELLKLAVSTADENGIKWQYKTLIAGGNESGVYQRSAEGAKVIAISAPTRYIHSQSNLSALSDMKAVAQLAAALNERSFD